MERGKWLNMAYVYADLDALAEYQQHIVQTLSTLEGQVVCKDGLIESTKAKIRAAIERAEKAERAAYTSIQTAEEQLYIAEQRTREYNSNLAEDQEPMTTPEFYYDNVLKKELEYSYAVATRSHAENTLANFEAYVRSYEQQQADGIEHVKKLLGMSGKFFESYIKKLVEVKKCTAVSAGSPSEGAGKGSGSGEVAGDPSGVVAMHANPALSVKESGKRWTDSLSKEQYAALRAYTGFAYVNINATLRGISASFQEGNKEKAVLIHQALSACSLPRACTVYRGASSSALGDLQNAPDYELVGSFFNDNGFMSTSLNSEDSFDGEIKLVISVPAGAKGAYVGYLSHLGHSESEVLFDMGAVMRITKVDRDKNGQRIIYAQMM